MYKKGMRKTGQDGKYQNINYNENIPITLEYVWDLKNGMNAERSVAVVIMLKKNKKIGRPYIYFKF